MDPEEINNEEDNDSEKKNVEEEEENSSKEQTPPADDNADNKEDEEKKKVVVKDYRPSTGEKEKKQETVPLKKYLDLKSKLKDLEGSKSSELDNKSIEEFADEVGLKPDVVKRLASIILAGAKDEAARVADERVKPIVLEKISRENSSLFEKDFDSNIAAVYPELADKKETFKKIAFSKDFLHLKTLEDIKNEFFPGVKATSKKEVKKDSPEGGSAGGGKESQVIDFAKMTPEQHAKVLADPKTRAKYYEWQDQQTL